MDKYGGAILCGMSQGLADRLMRLGNNGTTRGWPSVVPQAELGPGAGVSPQSRVPLSPAGQSQPRSQPFDSQPCCQQWVAQSGQASFS